MLQLLKKNETAPPADGFDFTINKDFEQVIKNCKSVTRKGQQGTWITDEVKKAYIALHIKGFAHSAEVWRNGRLAGGLYGVKLGKVFFGESMFSKEPNASKYAFIKYIQQLKTEGIELIDCQVYTEHLKSLGARMIPGDGFIKLLGELL
jgi:leucyl/phenylalanyl-tRNA--protein transferase